MDLDAVLCLEAARIPGASCFNRHAPCSCCATKLARTWSGTGATLSCCAELLPPGVCRRGPLWCRRGGGWGEEAATVLGGCAVAGGMSCTGSTSSWACILQHAVANIAQSLLHLLHALRKLLLQAGHAFALTGYALCVHRQPATTVTAASTCGQLFTPAAVLRCWGETCLGVLHHAAVLAGGSSTARACRTDRASCASSNTSVACTSNRVPAWRANTTNTAAAITAGAATSRHCIHDSRSHLLLQLPQLCRQGLQPWHTGCVVHLLRQRHGSTGWRVLPVRLTRHSTTGPCCACKFLLTVAVLRLLLGCCT